jgi:hypothetical protein
MLFIFRVCIRLPPQTEEDELSEALKERDAARKKLRQVLENTEQHLKERLEQEGLYADV